MPTSLFCEREAHKACRLDDCDCYCHPASKVIHESRPRRCGSTIADHVDQPWEQIGRCVYCICGEKLYQGTVPPTQEAKQRVADMLDYEGGT